MNTVEIHFQGRSRASFNYLLDNCGNPKTMGRLCEAFDHFISEISADLEEDKLIAEIENIRKRALDWVFGTEEPDSRTYIHESKKLSTTAYALLSGHDVKTPDEARTKVGNWVDLVKRIRNGSNGEGEQAEVTTGNSREIKNMLLGGVPFIFSWEGKLKSGIIRSFCTKFGSGLRGIPFYGDKDFIKVAIEEARNTALRNVFGGHTPGDQTYIDISDQIAVIAFAIRAGHPQVRTFDAAQKATGLENLRDEKPILLQGPRELATRARLGDPPKAALVKKDLLEIAKKAGDKVFTRDNPPKATTKPEVKDSADLVITTFASLPGSTRSYTFINGNSGELLGMGKLKRVMNDACVFEIDGTKSERSVNFFNFSLIVRKIKPTGITESQLEPKSGQVSFNPKADPVPVMGIYSSGDILGIHIGDSKQIMGRYFDFHMSDSGDLIVWFQDGRCIKAQGKEVIIQAYKEKET